MIRGKGEKAGGRAKGAEERPKSHRKGRGRDWLLWGGGKKPYRRKRVGKKKTEVESGKNFGCVKEAMTNGVTKTINFLSTGGKERRKWFARRA